MENSQAIHSVQNETILENDNVKKDEEKQDTTVSTKKKSNSSDGHACHNRSISPDGNDNVTEEKEKNDSEPESAALENGCKTTTQSGQWDVDCVPIMNAYVEDHNDENECVSNVPIVRVHSSSDIEDDREDTEHADPSSGEYQKDAKQDSEKKVSETPQIEQSPSVNHEGKSVGSKWKNFKETVATNAADTLQKESGHDVGKASSSSSSASSSSHSSSRFSFFRSIQNIIIATKWSRLRHSSSKATKNQTSGSHLLGEDQNQSKGEKLRKISQKSLSATFRKKSGAEEEVKQQQTSRDDNQLSDKRQDLGREGTEFLNSSSSGGNAKDKDKSPGHSKSYFSLIKRLSSDATSPPSPPPPSPPAGLTEVQKSLLRSSWAEIGDSVGQVGVIAFIGLFETHPDVKDSFNMFKDMSLDDVFNSISLKEHALRVMTTVEKFLNRIDRPDKLQKILEDLGKRHVAYRFNSDYINIVGKQFICAMRPHVSQWNPDTEEAWNVLVDTMTFHMQNGARMAPQQSTA